ncbi:autotransporter outer membrane beta-barrel domain-containing protein [Jinshanibacter sp. LJY008]|uniref:Autotransporter outer membrane beta-barrel domain-containing protein n=1 Tax=Limnobaculum eriocheiris TaxID=2897391 RepID=A0A9X1MWD7_9GAMM|nr:autotransporter outer membrane beta-barrel domain-containing protein [Limnobaculum eriocheiris]MCD1125843.1 autotransporter outer membrane beta-barrel domain-containing protein [Limnobaculum eriocheiris]
MKKTLLACAISSLLLGASTNALAFTEDVRGITVSNELVIAPPPLSNGYIRRSQSVWKGGIINNNTVSDGGYIYIQDGVANSTTVNQGGYLMLNPDEGALIRDTQVNNGGLLSFSNGSHSVGYLNVAQGGVVSIPNTVESIDITTNTPSAQSGITVENLKLAGLLIIEPSWISTPREDMAPAPSVLGEKLTSKINNLTLEGGNVQLIPYRAGGQFNRLEIQNLSGHGNFEMVTQLADNAGDFINVSGSATGQFGVKVTDSGKEPSAAAPLTLIHTNQGNAAFNLTNASGTVDLGVYQYKLYSTRNGDSTDWYLNTSPEKPTDSPATEQTSQPAASGNVTSNSGSKMLSNSAKGVLNMAAAPQYILSAELSTLRQRQGDLTLDQDGSAGVWARYTNDNSRISDHHNTGFKNNLNGLEIGGDKQLDLSQGKLLIGLFTSYSNTGVKFDQGGNGEVRSYGGGAYLTYLDSSGFYIDTVVKGNHLSNDIHTQSNSGYIAKGNYNQNAITASLEGGYNIPLWQTYSAEPYAKVQYSRIEGADYRLSNGMYSNIDDTDSVQGEMGTLLTTAFTANEMTVKPYIKLAIAREFIKSNNVSINNIDFNNNFSGNVGKYGLGIGASVSKNASVYTEVDYQNGNKVETHVRVDAGFRIRF